MCIHLFLCIGLIHAGGTRSSGKVDLPNPERGCAAIQDTFITNMGLDWGLSAALMGVHTLGKAQKKNSGYHGRWGDTENSRLFNNNYYKSLVSQAWAPKKAVGGNPNKNQWAPVNKRFKDEVRGESSQSVMMLDTDMCFTMQGASART